MDYKMTLEEAIKELKLIPKHIGPDCDGYELRALHCAIQALEKQAQIENDIGNFSDGYHTFNSLYHQRAVLFATIVNNNLEHSWKTHRHEDGELCFGGGWFLVTVETPEGSYGYHYEDRYWDIFKCQELPVAKHWDGYTDADVERLLSLKHQWHDLTKNPADTPDKYNCDWVLAQIVEPNGYAWIPTVAEYRPRIDDWYSEETGWLKNHDGAFSVVAWIELPTSRWMEEL